MTVAAVNNSAGGGTDEAEALAGYVTIDGWTPAAPLEVVGGVVGLTSCGATGTGGTGGSGGAAGAGGGRGAVSASVGPTSRCSVMAVCEAGSAAGAADKFGAEDAAASEGDVGTVATGADEVIWTCGSADTVFTTSVGAAAGTGEIEKVVVARGVNPAPAAFVEEAALV